MPWSLGAFCWKVKGGMLRAKRTLNPIGGKEVLPTGLSSLRKRLLTSCADEMAT